MDNKIIIAPSLLAADAMRFGEEIKNVTAAGADILHYDVMDGHFTPNLTFGPPILKAMKKVSSIPIDAHLMINEPQQMVGEYIKAGADMISVHAEVVVHLHRLICQIAEAGVKPAVALNPHTPWQSIEPIIPMLHHVLIMTVNPGFGGQAFIKEMLPKISSLKSYIDQNHLNTKIEVDGGITKETAPLVKAAGATMLVAGTAVFGADNRADAIAVLR